MNNDGKQTVPAVTLLPLESFQPAFEPARPGVRTSSVLMGAMIGGVVAITPAAHAQDPTLAPVLVEGQRENAYQAPAAASSPKFTAPLLETPKTVTTITEELIKDRGATSLQDVLRTTPGITLGSGEGGTPTGDRPFIRGYEASTDMFIDGVRDYARGSHETFNLESVEIIKGPSSAYTGRGGTGGSINLQTKAPRLEDFAEVSAGFGNAGQWRTTVDGNYAFSETGAVRVNAMKMGGEVPGRDGVDIDRWGIAPSIAFGLGTPTRLKLSYSHVENDDMPDLGIPFSNAAHPELKRPPKVDRDTFYGRVRTDFRNNEMKTATAQVEHDFTEDLTIRNITRQTRTLNHYLMTRPTFDNCAAGNTSSACIPGSPDAQFRRDDRMRWRSSESLINQTDLFGNFTTGAFKHSFSAGLEFSKEKIFSKSMANGPGRSHDSLHDPDSGQYYNYGITYGAKTADGEIQTHALYFFDTMEINEQFSVNAGVRREHYNVDNYRISRTDSFSNYQLGLVYKPAANGAIYLSYGTSTNPSGENLGQGGGADGSAASATVRDLAPEKSRSWELGTKWDVRDGLLSLTAAVFETRKTDARSTDPLTGDVTLSGNNRVRGAELGVAGAITSKWSVWAGYTYLDPKVLSYNSNGTVFDGNRTKFIAKQSASLWTTYDVLPGLTLGGGATYMGMRYANDANTLELPSYTRYDTMARYEINKRLNVQLNINNITDEELYDASHVGIFANVGPGRSYMLNATYRFD
ncbi:TonB-dependent receptor [Thauera linaloolentis]|uniref:TonB-dependent siderophore receptor n=1 Tax=Thauera linaloolentis (strain DSM 12138 / JCM 21573 / CCUG 41526 / CIP 105981 / IAM 15112 / NBRC 102519 / 47Lol) TaxID=1123367 RepID=N6YZ66_THAL4|nr:TonB-dependent siderophore receptor [Thauera linaloolentis]ENO85229.1 TonB-dependent siderophore receptor [Thauera linaloolentis 47Lol = DSM 12138]MCM8565106.1 TonB-dependent siderophore receptor [Thauera linaloolentis]